MGKAEDALRARERTSERAAHDADREQRAASAATAESIRAEVPRVLRTLEAEGYPGGKLIHITTASGRRFFSGKRWWKHEEKAAWRVWQHSGRMDEPAMTMWITSEGRFARSTPLTAQLQYVTLEWLAEHPAELERTANGIKQLLVGRR